MQVIFADFPPIGQAAGAVAPSLDPVAPWASFPGRRVGLSNSAAKARLR